MKHVIVSERIYVDAKGKRVGADYTGAKTLAHTPGNRISEERASELGIKSAAPAATKERMPADDKAAQGAASKGIGAKAREVILGKKED